VLTKRGNSPRFSWQKTGDDFFYPLLFQVIMEQMKNAAGFRARCVLVLSPLKNNSIDNRRQVCGAIRKVVPPKPENFSVVSGGEISETYTYLASSIGWQTISKSDQIESVLEDFFTNARELAKAIQESGQWKNTALDPSPAESSSASEEACKTTSKPE
jgi:hypothetical protein